MIPTSLVITRRYHFESGHWLPKVHEGHKCRRPHGHNYELHVKLTGKVGDNGFVIDFWDLDDQVQPVIALVDHRMLNDIPGLENPTAELIALWFRDRLRQSPRLRDFTIGIRLYETNDAYVDI